MGGVSAGAVAVCSSRALHSAGVGFALLLLAAGRVRADPPPELEGTLKQVIDAVARHDDQALRLLAEANPPDPWLVADSLLAMKKKEVAAQYAGVTPPKVRAALAPYVASWRETEESERERERLRDAEGFLAQGLHDAARIALVKAKAPARSVLGVLQAELRARSEVALGPKYQSEAQADYEKAAKLAGEIGWKAQELDCYWSKGDVARAALEYGNAREAWRLREQIALEIGNPRAIAEAANDLAVVCKEMGDLSSAEAGFRRAIEIYAKIGPAASHSASLANLAYVYQSLGRFANGLTSADAALDIAESAHKAAATTGGEALVLAATAVMNAQLARGTVRLEAGLHDDALKDFEAVLKEAKSTANAEAAAYAFANMGVTKDREEDFEAAELYERQALAYFEKSGNGHLVAQALANLVETLVHRGKGVLGLEYLSTTVDQIEREGDAVAACKGRWSLGVLSRRAGEIDEAIRLHEAGVKRAKELGIDGILVDHWSGLAAARLGKGEWKGALDAALSGRAVVGNLLGGLADEEYVQAREAIAELFEAGATASVRQKDVAGFASFVELGRAGALLRALGGRETTWSAVLEPAAAQADSEARAKESAAFAHYLEALKGGDRGLVAAARKEWDAGKAGRHEVARRIQREFANAGDVVYPAPRSLEELRAALKDDEALVLYALIAAGPAALVLRRTAAPRLVELPLDALASAPLSGPPSSPAPGPKPSAGESARRLQSLAETLAGGEGKPLDPTALAVARRFLVEPLALGADVRVVLLSIDSSFAHVPPALLFPDRAVAVVPSGTVLAILREKPAPQGVGVLGIGDPVYDSKVDDLGMRRLRDALKLGRLPNTRPEVEAIADVKLLGEDATEARLARAIPRDGRRLRAVHFACHGIMLSNDPSASTLALTASGESDGLLTSLEVLRMKIPADLVVLSACRSGDGRYARGEGLMGLARAFMVAGAPRVIASLWKVDDAATKVLMIKFYELWKSGKMRTAEALRSAQDWVRTHVDPATGKREWEEPRYWASWILWGLPE